MQKIPILVLGAGGHAAACIDVLESEGKYQILGCLGTARDREKTLLGYPVLGTDEDMPAHIQQCPHVLIGVGQIHTPEPRRRLFEKARALGAEFPVVCSPFAHVSPHALVGEGTIVMHGVTVQPRANVGQNAILNSHCLVEHDATVADDCHISTGAILNGGVQVGRGCFIGSRAVLQEGVVVPDGAVILMGEILRRSK